MYITSETVKQGWKYGKYSITHSKSMVGQTLFVKYPLETNNVNVSTTLSLTKMLFLKHNLAV